MTWYGMDKLTLVWDFECDIFFDALRSNDQNSSFGNVNAS